MWTKEGGHGGRHGTAVADQTQWEKVYEKTHDPSFATLVELKLLDPIKIMSGETLGVYVHSTLPGDQSIVYDNQRQYYADAVNHEACRDDGKLVILPGTAHLSNEPFGKYFPITTFRRLIAHTRLTLFFFTIRKARAVGRRRAATRYDVLGLSPNITTVSRPSVTSTSH